MEKAYGLIKNTDVLCELTACQITQSFRPIQIESICRRQFKCGSNHRVCLLWGRQHSGKRRKCCLPAFSPFPTMFLNAFLVMVVKTQALRGKESKKVKKIQAWK